LFYRCSALRYIITKKVKESSMIFDEEHLRKIEAQRDENPELAGLLAERDRLIKDYPHLRKLQDEIDRLLGTTIDPAVRLEILFMLMTDKLHELKGAFSELVKQVDNVRVSERIHKQRPV
jgi:hypothetical protein